MQDLDTEEVPLTRQEQPNDTSKHRVEIGHPGNAHRGAGFLGSLLCRWGFHKLEAVITWDEIDGEVVLITVERCVRDCPSRGHWEVIEVYHEEA